MWTYEKHLQYPVNITKTNAQLAKVILTQFGGPDGELAASQRYLSQRYSMSNRKVAGVLTDIGVSVGKLRMGKVKDTRAALAQIGCRIYSRSISSVRRLLE